MISILLLVVGYVLAVPPLFRLRRVWRKRIWWAYAIETAGAACITLGWLWRGGSTGAVVVNGAWTLLWGIAFPIWALSRRGDAQPDATNVQT